MSRPSSLTSASQSGVDDLATLTELSDKLILHEIITRYQQNLIYTFIADIMIAVNPYKSLDIYTPQIMSQYCHLLVRNSLPPHIFHVSTRAFNNMRRDGKNQCCIVLGESGTGKTENAKFLIQHIVHHSRSHSSDLQQRIIMVNPLLEAFGNARTSMNNNSSRFGKLFELFFDQNSELYGAKITEYLLEKNRVVSPMAGQRNYHIFYFLLAGLDPQKQSLNLLKEPTEHRIVSPVDGTEVFPDRSAVEFCKSKWNQVKDLMLSIGFSNEQYDGVIAILTAIIHITDIKFVHDTDTDGVYIENEELVEIVTLLLGIVKPENMMGALIASVTKVQEEEVVVLKDVYQAAYDRDALAKSLYDRLFSWIIRRTNELLKLSSNKAINGHEARTQTSISVLDIYGFENFPQNSFEQLCINATNEELQNFFIRRVFLDEREACALEKIKVKSSNFQNNDQIMKLLFDTPGVFSLIDEDSFSLKATDLTLHEKLCKNLKQSTFQKVKNQPLMFIVQHSAGSVQYNAYGFLEKNRDLLSANLRDLLEQSQSTFIQDMLSIHHVVSDEGAASILRSRVNSREVRRSVILSQPLNFAPSAERSSKVVGAQMHKKCKKKGSLSHQPTSNVKTMTSYFKTSFKELIATLASAESHFIRCIKPNADKRHDLIDAELVLKQFRYHGILETVSIRRHGFAIQLPYERFFERYRIITFPLKTAIEPNLKNCKRILSAAGITDYETGKTRVFLRYNHVDSLDATVAAVVKKIVICQSHVREFLSRLNYSRIRSHQLQCSAYQVQCLTFGQLVSDFSKASVSAQHRMIVEDKRSMLKPFKKQQELMAKAAADAIVKRQQTPLSPPPQPDSIKPLSSESTEVSKSKPRPPVQPRNAKAPERTSNPEPEVHHPPSSVPVVQQSVAEMSKDTKERWSDLTPDFWCKVYYYERGSLISKVLFTKWDWCIDNSNSVWTGDVLGLSSAFVSQQRIKPNDDDIEVIMTKIGQGLKVNRDANGNIYISKLTGCDVTVRGCNQTRNNCLSGEVIQLNGRLPHNDKIKVFDMLKFLKHIAGLLQNKSLDFDTIHSMCTVSICFTSDDADEQNISSWFSMINFYALEKLTTRDGFVLIIQMSGIPLTDEHRQHLQDALSVLPPRT